MSVRIEKVAETIKKEISMILIRETSDPAFGFVTITTVKLSKDLRVAKVYVSVLEKDIRSTTLDHLNNAKGHIRSKLANKLHLRHVPELNFYIDDTFDYVENIENLIKEIHKNDNESNS